MQYHKDTTIFLNTMVSLDGTPVINVSLSSMTNKTIGLEWKAYHHLHKSVQGQ